jgi:heme-degrading monooxygenase HmoA
MTDEVMPGNGLTLGPVWLALTVLPLEYVPRHRNRRPPRRSKEASMIARQWHGRVPAERADAYYEYLLRTGLPDYRRTPGNRGVYVFRRREGAVAHFLLTTLWDSIESIRAFAGEDVERARYYPEDTGFLLELEPTVTHFEVLTTPAGDHEPTTA